jgi:hypothetical protein
MQRSLISWVLVSCIALACGGGDVPSVDGGVNDAAPVDAEGSCPPEGAACAVEGMSCGAPCTDVCSFCNILRCDSGVWTRYEVFPAPCFACGDELRCVSDGQYCNIQRSDVAGQPDDFACQPMPDTCRTDPTCACLEMEDVYYDQCTGEPGELTLETFGG